MNFAPLKAFMDDMARNRTPGNAVKVYLQGKPVFQYSSGFSDWENQIPLKDNELYNIYSCSKVATVTAGLQLVEQGKCRLDDPLYAYIPEYRDMYKVQADGFLKKARNAITLRHLFTMTAGLTYNMGTPSFQRARELTKGHMDTLDVIRCIADDPLSFEPGAHWQYSLCHDVLAGVIIVISGIKFREYMQTYLFDPLDMQESCYHHTPQTLERTAPQYEFVSATSQSMDLVDLQRCGKDEAGIYQRMDKNNPLIHGDEYDSGGAGIITSVSDYAKLMAALANNGLGLTGERILSQDSVTLLRRNALNEVQLQDLHDNWGQLAGCGYGLGVRTHMDPKKSGLCCNIGEFGWGGAAGATAIVDPEIGLGVFYAQHIHNPREEYYQPRLRDIVYRCL